MFKRLHSLFCRFAIAGAIVAGGIPLTGVTEAPITVGVIISSSGPFASLGVPIRDSIVMAQKEINAHGGVAGRPIAFDIEDDGGKPDTAVQLATAMAGRGISIIIGGCTTPVSIALKRETVSAGILQIYSSPTAQVWDTPQGVVGSIFEVVPRNEVEMQKLIAFARTSLHAGSIAILHDENSYGTIAADLIASSAKAQNVAIVGNEQFATTATDLTPQIIKLRAAKPDLIFLWGVSPAAALGVRQIKQLGVKATVFTGGGNLNDNFLKITGTDADGLYSDSSLNFTHPNAAQSALMALYRSNYHERANNFTAYGWDAAHIAALALINAHGKTDPTALQSALETMRPYVGATATYRFSKTDHNGIDAADVHIATAENAVWFTR